jgi:hypothetical protein
VSATLLNEALGALLDGARMATRFAVEGESVRKGPRPAWLDAACDFAVTGLSPGSAVIALEAPALRDVDPDRFGAGNQPSLFSEPDDRFGEQSAIDVFGDLLAEILHDGRDDVIADRALLDGCVRFARVAGGGFAGVVLDGLLRRSSPLEIHTVDARRLEQLRDETPRPHAVRVAGTLDTVALGRRDVVLTLDDGTRVPGRMGEYDLETLRTHLGAKVVVSGMAHYRPSGRLLLVDVEAIDLTRAEDRIFGRMPAARKQRLVLDAAVAGDAAGVAAFFGTWPGEESDEELLDALKDLG